MPEKAHITSIEALEAFRNTLILYISKARPTVEEVSSDVTRVKLWLQNDQRMHWEGEVRRRTKQVEQAQAALFSNRVSNLRQESSAEQLALQKARRALDEAQEKLKRLKAWNREFDTRVEPLVKQLEKLHSVLSIDMLQATNYLAQAVETLQAYADVFPSGSTATVSTDTASEQAGAAPGSAASPGTETSSDQGGSQ